MTVQRPHGSAHAGAVAPSGPGAIDLAEAIDLARLEGRDGDARDAIVLSPRANVLVRAGLAVKALVIHALMQVDQSLTLGARMIVLEFGVYRSS